MNDISNRKGHFLISGPAMDLLKASAFALGIRIMSEIFVVKADYNPLNDVFEYYAYSPKFDVVAEGEIAPDYRVIIDKESNAFEVRFERV